MKTTNRSRRVIEHLKDERYGKHDFPDVRLTVADLKELVQRFKALIKERTGKSFPQDPQAQLWGAIGAVFGSWMNDRAIVYRRKYGIPHDWGTAVNVQTMVFGNMGETSATGVAFTRDPATGEKVFYGEYLINAQGEDVVAGVRTPHPIADLAKEMPAAHKELMKVRAILEQHFKDMQDLEFTVEDNRLYILQTRNGKRTGLAAVRIAVEMVDERLITKKDAINVSPRIRLPICSRRFSIGNRSQQRKKSAAVWPPARARLAAMLCLARKKRSSRSERGEKVVLARIETSPEDLRGMIAAEGILTSRGGVSSHAALVARQMGKVCVCGAAGIEIDYQKRTLCASGVTLNEGDYISIDGTAGEVFAGEVTTAPSEIVQVLVDRSLDRKKERDLSTIRKAHELGRSLAQTRRAHQCRYARAGEKRDRVWRGRHRALPNRAYVFRGRSDRRDARDDSRRNKGRRGSKRSAKLLPYQREDFVGIFQALDGLPATIRFLDPPLHEFFPHDHRAATRSREQTRRAGGRHYSPRARAARI